jgi:predicted nucleotidyltransferase component of viral defense system
MLKIALHRQVLFGIITEIYKKPWSSYLGFKGGTMAYFFYGLDRFSVDLDFDLLDFSKLETIKKELPPIFKKYGTIRDYADKHFTLFYLLNYEKGQRNLKIEISKRVELPVEYTFANFFGIQVKIMKEEDAFATKILACITRKAIAYRDFYDVYFYLSKNIVPKEEVIKKGINLTLKEAIKKLISLVKKEVTNQKMINAIGELIDENGKIWIKKEFKQSLINKLEFFYTNL